MHNKQPSLEAQLANVADEIAYNNHDVDDGLRYGLLDIEQLMDVELFASEYDALGKRYPQLPLRRRVHETIRHMINRVVVDLIEHSSERLTTLKIKTIDDVRGAKQPLLANTEEIAGQAQTLKQSLRENLYDHYRVRRMSRKAARIIKQLYSAFIVV